MNEQTETKELPENLYDDKIREYLKGPIMDDHQHELFAVVLEGSRVAGTEVRVRLEYEATVEAVDTEKETVTLRLHKPGLCDGETIMLDLRAVIGVSFVYSWAYSGNLPYEAEMELQGYTKEETAEMKAEELRSLGYDWRDEPNPRYLEPR